MGYFVFIVWYILLWNKLCVFIVLGEDKSKLVGFVNVLKVLFGSTLSSFLFFVCELYGVVVRVIFLNDVYDVVV